MNPIAFIAFLVGINSSPPTPPSTAAQQKQNVEEPRPKPQPDAGRPKVHGGGWDAN